MLSVVRRILGSGRSEGSLSGNVDMLNVDGRTEGSVVEHNWGRLGVKGYWGRGRIAARGRRDVVDPLAGVHGQRTGAVADGTGHEDGCCGNHRGSVGDNRGSWGQEGWAWAVAGAGEEGWSWTGKEDLAAAVSAASIGLRNAKKGGDEDEVLVKFVDFRRKKSKMKRFSGKKDDDCVSYIIIFAKHFNMSLP